MAAFVGAQGIDVGELQPNPIEMVRNLAHLNLLCCLLTFNSDADVMQTIMR